MLLSLAACGGSEEKTDGGAVSNTPDSGSKTSSAQNLHEVTEPVEIEFWHNYSDENRAKWIEDVAAEFSAAQDMVTVKLVYIGGYPSIAEQVAGAIAAHSGVPAITIQGKHAAAFSAPVAFEYVLGQIQVHLAFAFPAEGAVHIQARRILMPHMKV